MNRFCRISVNTCVVALFVFSSAVVAEEHIAEVLLHTDDAVRAEGDSQAIGRHAFDALELIDEAREANSARPDVLEYIEHGEEELSSAVRNARQFNSSTAWQDAVDAKRYLNAADQAASGPSPR